VNGVEFSSNCLSSSRFFLARYPASPALPRRISIGTTHQMMIKVMSNCILLQHLAKLNEIKDVARRRIHLALSGTHYSSSQRGDLTLPRSAREVPKDIAAFGEKQFKETGAAVVEVLRVKAAVMRKHFKQLKGITFLVAVVSRDRGRIYFFNAAGVMLVGENVEPSMYQKVRSTSKLIAKFEKPRELTPEELRIEATQELRDSLTKAMRRVSRSLATTSPSFPDIFVTRSSLDEQTQNFGLQISSENEFIFEEAALKSNWQEGLITRTAFLAHLSPEQAKMSIASMIGNGLALALLKDPGLKAYREFWLKLSKETEWAPFVNHLDRHSSCYSNEGFVRLHSLIQQAKSSTSLGDWFHPLRIIHGTARVSIGTEEYHVIQKFCKILSKPRKLISGMVGLESIHLSPRVVCDPTPLDIQISISHGPATDDDWMNVSYQEGSTTNVLRIGPEAGTVVTGLEYWLNLEDIYPTSGGLVSHGKSVLQRAFAALGFVGDTKGTYEASIEFSDTHLASNEKAVLERLILGKLEVLTNTMIGSPQIIDQLLSKGKIVLLPFFNHIGVDHEYLLKGEPDALRTVSRNHCLEATTLLTDEESVSVVSAPSTWRSGLLEAIRGSGVSIWPIHSATSIRNIIRNEDPFSEIN